MGFMKPWLEECALLSMLRLPCFGSLLFFKNKRNIFMNIRISYHLSRANSKILTSHYVICRLCSVYYSVLNPTDQLRRLTLLFKMMSVKTCFNCYGEYFLWKLKRQAAVVNPNWRLLSNQKQGSVRGSIACIMKRFDSKIGRESNRIVLVPI